MFSFHSHSGQFCMHAKGTLEQVVNSAVARGFTHYGLSEHMPRYQPDQLYPEESHLTVKDLEQMYDRFLVEASRLQTKYSSQICLLVGMETEYFGPASIDYVRKLRQDRQDMVSSSSPAKLLPRVQYIVGSLHHVRGIPLDFSTELYLKALEMVGEGSWEQLFKVYFDAQFEMLQGLQPEVVGHLDLVRIFFGAIPQCSHHQHDSQPGTLPPEAAANVLTDELWSLVRRNIDYVISYGGLFELNSRAWKKGLADAYPQRDILQYIIEKEGRITLSDDSHGPDDVGMFYDPELKRYLEQMKIEKVFYLVPASLDPKPAHPTQARKETMSFQHVVVQAMDLAELRFFSKE
ncbi:histidinol-phosphatase (PHP family) [Entomortierella parvispora]|uniref:Histidinol-phosphatase n=1 Tax=Entomortierella parvispora TaxID=205924 RepID=A0A9P3HF41_9FUNG|nr:histidinol-phosphatase (PHP family) [Entomortierella parvispora]